MAAYAYKLRAPDGRLKKGTVQAGSLVDAMQKVHALGGVSLDVHEVKETKKGGKPFMRKGLSLKEKIVFTEQLAVMLQAGITLVAALKGIQEETENKALAALLVQVIADVEGGLSFSVALSKHPQVFSRIYCEMIRSAEKSGNVAGVLNKLTQQQQKEYELKGKVRGALMYPAIVSVLLLSVIILVITFILPKLTGLFADSNVALPLSTRILIATSNIFVNYWYLLLGGVVALAVGFKLMLRNPRGLLFWDTVKLRIPIVGNFMRKSYMARVAQSFASLSEAGVPVLEIFTTLEGVVDNALYEQELRKIAADVANGIKVSTAIRKSPHFPAMVGQLVSVGEQSGDLAEVFNVLGEFFEKEVDTIARNLSTMLEPIIMIVMGIAVGFVLVSVMQPILNLSNSIN